MGKRQKTSLYQWKTAIPKLATIVGIIRFLILSEKMPKNMCFEKVDTKTETD